VTTPPRYQLGQIVRWHNPYNWQDCPAIICNVRDGGRICDLHVFGWGGSVWPSQPGMGAREGTGPGQFELIV
jgi:hypothetical protein